MESNKKNDNEYKYGFKDDIESIQDTGKGLSEEVVRVISKAKNEPEWMLDFRLKAYKKFLELPFPSFGPDVSNLDFNSYTYFTRYVKGEKQDWDKVPDKIKDTFKKLGIPDAEQKYLAGAATQYESEMVIIICLKKSKIKELFSFQVIWL